MARIVLTDGNIFDFAELLDRIQFYRQDDTTKLLQPLFKQLGIIWKDDNAFRVNIPDNTHLTIAPGQAIVAPTVNGAKILAPLTVGAMVYTIAEDDVGSTAYHYVYLQYIETEEEPLLAVSPHVAMIEQVTYAGRANGAAVVVRDTPLAGYPPDQGYIYLGYYYYDEEGTLIFVDERGGNVAILDPNVFKDTAPPPAPVVDGVTYSYANSTLNDGAGITLRWHFDTTDLSNVAGIEIKWDPPESWRTALADDAWIYYTSDYETGRYTIRLPIMGGNLKVRSVGRNGRYSTRITVPIEDPFNDAPAPTIDVVHDTFTVKCNASWNNPPTDLWGVYYEITLTTYDGHATTQIYKKPANNPNIQLHVGPRTQYNIRAYTVLKNGTRSTAYNEASGTTSPLSTDDLIDRDNLVIRNDETRALTIDDIAGSDNLVTTEAFTSLQLEIERNVQSLLESKADAAHTHPEYVTFSDLQERVTSAVAASISQTYLSLPLTGVKINEGPNGKTVLGEIRTVHILYVNQYDLVYNNTNTDEVYIRFWVGDTETPVATLTLAANTAGTDHGFLNFSVPVGATLQITIEGSDESKVSGLLIIGVTHNYKLTTAYQQSASIL